MVNTVLLREQVERATGLSRSTLYEMVARGRFPKPIRIGARSVAWISEEVQAWLEARIAERDAEEAT